ncbi:unnamed protein product [Oikopleura dioica]|uniref:Carbohydrate kinase PfkB domain-containing protein n=1 Tax=Oikopleura dioica TaxID=34765 RepID=E4Y0I9_OIKDI|nr:unnamed protein product [Oikopleura dioica]
MSVKILVVGSLNVDQIAYCPRLPLPGETILGEKYETGLGGKGANQAAQAALLSSPGEVVLFGAVGNDKNGIWYLEELAKTGVDCSKIKTKESSTGVAPITVSMENGENSIVVVPGANMLFTEEDLDEKSFEGIKIVVCQNEIPVCTTRKALELGRLSGAQTIYSPAPCPKREDFETFCEKIDYLIANETEALQLSGSENISEAVEALQKKYKIKNVIVTLGSDGFAFKKYFFSKNCKIKSF